MTTVPEIPQALDTDVFITRAFNAPRDVVWKFFTEPEYMAKWFGPATTHVPVETTAKGAARDRRCGSSEALKSWMPQQTGVAGSSPVRAGGHRVRGR